jgi:hypothetical protein
LHHVFIFSNIGFQVAANDKSFFICIINSWLLRFKNGSSFFNWLRLFFYFFYTLLDFGFFFFYSSFYSVFSNLPRPPLLWGWPWTLFAPYSMLEPLWQL